MLKKLTPMLETVDTSINGEVLPHKVSQQSKLYDSVEPTYRGLISHGIMPTKSVFVGTMKSMSSLKITNLFFQDSI